MKENKITRRNFLKVGAAASAAGLLSAAPVAASAAQPDAVGAAEEENGLLDFLKKPKYIFLFIGDGMGTAQIQSARFYKGTTENNGAITERELSFTSFPEVGSVTTYDSTSFCPDSASTATAIATGNKTESGVINKTALVYGQMNEPPGARMRVALSGLTMAEYFREETHKDVLLFIDNIFRFVQAGSEVSALMGRMPSAVGYQPTLANELGALQERITSTRDGSITSVQAVYVPADDLTDPAPATTFAHLDATTVLSRKIVEQGIYPAVDPLDSTSGSTAG